MKFIGNLVIPAMGAVNNKTTATPFSIPVGCPALEVRTTAADAFVEVANDAAVPPTFQTSSSTGLPLVANSAINLDCPPFNPGCSPVVAAVSAGGATVEVWALWGL